MARVYRVSGFRQDSLAKRLPPTHQAVAEPLAVRYPRNLNFRLLLGNLNAELGRREAASRYFHQVLESPDPEAGGCAECAGSAPNADQAEREDCAAHARYLATAFLASLH